MKMRDTKGLHTDRTAHRRGDHRDHRGDRGARPSARAHGGQRSVGDRLAARRQQRGTGLQHELRAGLRRDDGRARQPPATGGQPFISPGPAGVNPIVKSGYNLDYTPGVAIAGAARFLHGCQQRRPGADRHLRVRGRADFAQQLGRPVLRHRRAADDLPGHRGGHLRRSSGPRAERRFGSSEVTGFDSDRQGGIFSEISRPSFAILL